MGLGVALAWESSNLGGSHSILGPRQVHNLWHWVLLSLVNCPAASLPLSIVFIPSYSTNTTATTTNTNLHTNKPHTYANTPLIHTYKHKYMPQTRNQIYTQIQTTHKYGMYTDHTNSHTNTPHTQLGTHITHTHIDPQMVLRHKYTDNHSNTHSALWTQYVHTSTHIHTKHMSCNSMLIHLHACLQTHKHNSHKQHE